MASNPKNCSRCHFRAITHRLESLCDDCYEIKVLGTRVHRRRVVPCDSCERKFKDYHGLELHKRSAHAS